MKNNLLAVFSFFIFFAGSAQGQSVKNNLKIQWETESGEKGASSVIQASSNENQKRLMFLAWLVPGIAITSAEQNVDGEWRELSLKNQGGKKYLLLTSQKAELRLKKEEGTVVQYKYELEPTESTLQISSSCAPFMLKAKAFTALKTSFPAMINCQTLTKENTEVVFSSLDEAEWAGSNAFESDGKGARWKSFALKDISALESWDIAWGSKDQLSRVQVVSVRPKKNPPVVKAPLTFQVGAAYLTGKISSNSVSTDLGGFQIPLSVNYQPTGSWWFLGSSYELFLYSFSKGSNGSSSSTSSLGAWGGLEYRLSSFRIRGKGAYLSRTFNTQGSGTASTFEAPQLGAELIYERNSMAYGLLVDSATTSAGGSYSEMNIGLYSQFKGLFSKEQRVFFKQTQLKAKSETANSAELDSSWMSLGLFFEF